MSEASARTLDFPAPMPPVMISSESVPCPWRLTLQSCHRPAMGIYPALLLHDGQIPRPNRQYRPLGRRLPIQEVGSRPVGVVRLHLGPRVVEVVMDPLAHLVHAMLDMHRGGQLLIRSGQPEFLQRI